VPLLGRNQARVRDHDDYGSARVRTWPERDEGTAQRLRLPPSLVGNAPKFLSYNGQRSVSASGDNRKIRHHQTTGQAQR
jgi:hypothetical protein